MLGRHSISGWGIAPNKHGAKPEVLGFGYSKMIVTGFVATIFIYIPKLFTALNGERRQELTKGMEDLIPAESAWNLQKMQDYLLAMPSSTVPLFCDLMKGWMFKSTSGAGCLQIVPPGSMFMFLCIDRYVTK